MSYFVTGTDTGVGKTLISCALLHGFAARQRRVVGYKPIAAGCDADGYNDDAGMLRAASTMPLAYEQVNSYCLRDAVAPHIAARNEGQRIELPHILAAYRELAGIADEVIVEGAGGFLVPLNEKQNTADMARALSLPVILVTGMRLGCLNHALLTAEAIAARGLKLAGWVANQPEGGMLALNENIAALQERIAAPLLGVVLHQPQPDAQKIAGLLNLRLLEAEGVHD